MQLIKKKVNNIIDTLSLSRNEKSKAKQSHHSTPINCIDQVYSKILLFSFKLSTFFSIFYKHQSKNIKTTFDYSYFGDSHL